MPGKISTPPLSTRPVLPNPLFLPVRWCLLSPSLLHPLPVDVLTRWLQPARRRPRPMGWPGLAWRRLALLRLLPPAPPLPTPSLLRPPPDLLSALPRQSRGCGPLPTTRQHRRHGCTRGGPLRRDEIEDGASLRRTQIHPAADCRAWLRHQRGRGPSDPCVVDGDSWGRDGAKSGRYRRKHDAKRCGRAEETRCC
jgi:hypothetical protein